MDGYKQNRNDPWDPALYETGRTRPPKSHGGLVAFLLAAVIFLGGLVSAMGVLNIKLFAQLKQQGESADPVSFVSPEETTGASMSPTESDVKTVPEPNTSALELNPSIQSQDNTPQDGALPLQQLYEKNIPSVVSISCTTGTGTVSGTGVILSQDGYIVTNCHVVEGAQSMQVQLTDDRSFSARLVGADTVSDLAVLQIDAENLTPAEFGDSSVLRVGDAVAAIGDPLGAEFRGTLTDGIISAINRNVISEGRTLTLIQTNAALNTGNSGGPLINCYGQVIGINTMKIGALADASGVEGLGFAIPSTTVKEIVDQLIGQGYVSGRPTLGLTGESVSIFLQRYYRMPAGLYINQVENTSSAAAAGIAPGDILLSIDGTRISDVESMNAVIYRYQVGDTVNVIIYRSGQQYAVQLTLTESKG